VVKEKSYFATNDQQGGNPAGASNLRDGGVAPMHKIPQEFSLDSFRLFPGE